MSQTRRDFIIMTGVGMCALYVTPPVPAAPFPSEPALLEGDPYTAHVDECGLGGRSWDSAYEHALRFRSTAEDRDRYVLGLEI